MKMFLTRDELGSLKTTLERPVFAVAFLLFAVFSVALLVTAAFLLGGIDSTNELLFSDYQAAEGIYQSGGAILLPLSSFGGFSSTGLLSPFALNTSQVSISSYPPFLRYSFQSRLMLPSVSLNLNSAAQSTVNVSLTLVSDIINGTISSMSLPPVPMYAVSVIGGSARDQQRCALNGGVLQAGTGLCVRLSVLSSICVQLSLNMSAALPYWIAVPPGGCVYPFDAIGLYRVLPPTANTTLFGLSAPVSVTLLSGDDPVLVMEAAAAGFEPASLQSQQQRQGTAIVICAAAVIAAVLVALIVRRVVKARQQRAVSAAMADITVALVNPAERGAPMLVRPHVKDSRLWLQLGGAVGLLGIGIGVGLTLISNWSMQNTFSWQAYAGLVLLLLIVPPGFALFVLFIGSVIRRQHWPSAARATVLFFCAAVCLTGTSVSVVFLINPTQPVGTDPGNGDQLTIFMGVALSIITLALGAVCSVMFVRLAVRACVRAPSTVAAAAGQRSDFTLNSLPQIERDRTPHAIRATLALFAVYVFLFVCCAALPPIWNVAQSVYNDMPSPYAVLPWLLPDGFSIKVYPDVITYYGFILLLAMVGLLRTLLRDSLGRWMTRRFRCGPASPYNPLFRLGATPGEIMLLSAFLALCAFWFWYWFAGYGRIAAMTLNVRLARTLGHMTSLSMSLLVLPVARDSIWQRLFGIPFDSALRYHRALGVWVFVAMTSHMFTWNIEWLRGGVWVNNVFTISLSHSPDDFTIPLVELAWLCTLTLVLTALPYVRKMHFEWFHYTHHLFMFVFLAALVHAWSLWYFLSGSLLLWLVDRLLRFVRGTQDLELVRVDVGASHITRLVFRGDIHWYPGQYAFLNVPAVSSLEWHPFTISSSPLANIITFHIKDVAIPRRITTTAGILAPARTAEEQPKVDGAYADIDALRTAVDRERRIGQFTHRLALWAGAARRSLQAGHRVTVAVDGPYGGWSGYADHTALLLIAGGVGITPLHSIYQDLVLRACADLRAERTDSYVNVNTGAASRVARSKTGTMYDDIALGPAEFNLALRDQPLPGTRVRHVHLVWVADHDNTLCVFAETLRRANAIDPTGACFTYALHSTERRDGDADTAWRLAERLQSQHAADALYDDVDPDAVAATQARIVRGRPVLRDVFAEYARTMAGERVAALVCGPESMIAASSELSFEHGFSFFTEDFFL